MSARGAVTRVPGLPSRWPLVVAVVGGALTLAWVAAAVAMSSRGFDITDEGYYLLSYRWWHEDLLNASGVQYVYGPLFEALGYSVKGLRIARMVTVLAGHLVFAWAFLQWLRSRRPELLTTPGSSWAIVLTLTASGGVTYGWLPLSPGYNDVAMLGSLLMAAALLCTVARASAGRRLSVLPALALGPALVALVLAKWAAAAVVLVFLAAMAVWALRPWRPQGTWRYLGVLTGSVVVSLVVVDVVVEPFSEMIPPILEVTRRVAAGTNSPTQLIPAYLLSTIQLLGLALVIVLFAAPVVALGVVLGRRRDRRVGRLVVALGPVFGLLVVNSSSFGLPEAGAAAITGYSAALVAMALIVGAVAVYEHRVDRQRSTSQAQAAGARPGRHSDTAVVVLLLLLPPVQALGTGNKDLYVLAVNQFVCWVALMVLAVLTLPRDTWTRTLAGTATAVAVVVAAAVGVQGLLLQPYRTGGWADSTTTVGGSGPLAGLRVSPREAATFRDLRTATGSSATSGRPVFAFDEMPGLVLALNGTSVGEPWYSAIDQSRTAAGIRSECAQAPIAPTHAVILFSRAPEALDERALASCGLALQGLGAEVPLFGVDGRVSVYRAVTDEEGP